MFTVFTSVALLSGFEMNIYILDIVFCDIEVDEFPSSLKNVVNVQLSVQIVSRYSIVQEASYSDWGYTEIYCYQGSQSGQSVVDQSRIIRIVRQSHQPQSFRKIGTLTSRTQQQVNR